MADIFYSFRTVWFELLMSIIFIVVVVIVIAMSLKSDSSSYLIKLKPYAQPVLIALLGVVVFSVIVLYLDTFGTRDFSSDPEQWGQMGDYFGGMLNPILAFASFIALLYTIGIQSDTQREFTSNAKNDRYLSLAIPEYQRFTASMELILEGLDTTITSEIAAGPSSYISIAEIFGNSIREARHMQEGRITELCLEEQVKKISQNEAIDLIIITEYLHDVARLKLLAMRIDKNYARLSELTEAEDLFSDGWYRIAKHLIFAQTLSLAPRYFHAGPAISFISNLPAHLKNEVDRMAKDSFRIELDS
ncbi:hypothetical protein EMM73_00005 [Rheinheimera sediminis]|uniref:hypothetical protein n=1 Tax=Rheinheimera sp. YQF-1 TaxID=2499626 RepID=UPI000FDBE39C|nr:hypothetical protein [Rheinheimera sp. YQF-1]RVT49026.1 hypothetical protein EMM73_00005 [Rheinheimera sp. YQF-1]